MSLFTREQRPPAAAAEPGRPAPGILLTSALDPGGCLRVLGQTLLSFRVPEYTHLPSFTSVGWAWAGGSAAAPETVISCADRTGDDVLVALWPAADRPYIGGSQNNSLWNLIFGYNGFGRLTGNEAGSVGGGGQAGSRQRAVAGKIFFGNARQIATT